MKLDTFVKRKQGNRKAQKLTDGDGLFLFSPRHKVVALGVQNYDERVLIVITRRD